MLCDWIPDDILEKFEVHNYNHAAEILSQSFPVEFREVVEALRRFEIARKEIVAEGGNESSIPPKFAAILEPDGWKELRISGDLHIKFFPPQRGETRAIHRYAFS